MCRLFGLHAGSEPVRATFWLLDAPDSLSVQSDRNPDGYGLATWEPDGSVDIDKRPVRAHGDDLFACEARHECSTTYLAHVRYASVGDLTPENTHPFAMDGRAFAHNGVIGELDRIEAALGDVRDLVRGDTDSERLFALITRHVRDHDGDVTAGIVSATRWLAAEIELFAINFVLTTPDELWALRYPAHNELWMLDRTAGGARGSRHLDQSSARGTLRLRSSDCAARQVVVIASEPMDEDPAWTPIEPGELVHVGSDLEVSRDLILPDSPGHPMDLTGTAARSQAQEQPAQPNA